MAIFKQKQAEMIGWESAPLLCAMKMPGICAAGMSQKHQWYCNLWKEMLGFTWGLVKMILLFIQFHRPLTNLPPSEPSRIWMTAFRAECKTSAINHVLCG